LERSFSSCGMNGEADAKVLKLQSVTSCNRS
jgi:hypothetical protein